MLAPELNTKFEKLGTKFDKYATDLTKDDKNVINGSISNWQDWYYSEENYGSWLKFDEPKWSKRYKKSNKLLTKRIEAKKLKAKKPVILKPTKHIIAEPVLVKGYSPLAVGILLLVTGLGGYLTYRYNA